MPWNATMCKCEDRASTLQLLCDKFGMKSISLLASLLSEVNVMHFVYLRACKSAMRTILGARTVSPHPRVLITGLLLLLKALRIPHLQQNVHATTTTLLRRWHSTTMGKVQIWFRSVTLRHLDGRRVNQACRDPF